MVSTEKYSDFEEEASNSPKVAAPTEVAPSSSARARRKLDMGTHRMRKRRMDLEFGMEEAAEAEEVDLE